MDVKIITVAWDGGTGLFEDSHLAGYLAGREVLRCQPEFFRHEGRPYWSVFVESRPLQGAERRPKEENPSNRQFDELLAELDEVERARYHRLRSWRKETSLSSGVAPFTLLTNRQMLELARRAPRTLGGLAAVKGIGPKRVKRHGRVMLEVMHGKIDEAGAADPHSVREVDGHDALADGADTGVSQTPPAQPDQPD